jgi:hypothetical protein
VPFGSCGSRCVHARSALSCREPPSFSGPGQDVYVRHRIPGRTVGKRVGATPHEFESRVLRQCLTEHDVEGPHRPRWGPSTGVLAVRAWLTRSGVLRPCRPNQPGGHPAFPGVGGPRTTCPPRRQRRRPPIPLRCRSRRDGWRWCRLRQLGPLSGPGRRRRAPDPPGTPGLEDAARGVFRRRVVCSGVEGTIRQLAHGHGVRRCRCRGQVKARVRLVLTLTTTRSPGIDPGEEPAADHHFPNFPRSPAELGS